MAKLTVPNQKPGDYYDLSKDQAVQDGVTAIVDTNLLTEDNLGKESIDTFNLTHADNSYGIAAEYSGQTGSTATITSATGTRLSHGTGGQVTFSPNLTVNAGDVVRLHGNFIAGLGTVSASSGAPAQDDEFFCWFYSFDGASTYTDLGPQWGNSLQQRNQGANQGTDTDLTATNFAFDINFRRVGFSWTFIAGASFSTAEFGIYVRVANATNSIVIEDYSISAVIQRS